MYRKLSQYRKVIVLAILLLVIGFYLLAFPGRRLPIPDTPYTLIIQPGVSEESIQLVITGLRLADTYLQGQLKQTVKQPVEVRIASFSPCSPLTPLLWTSATAQVQGNRLCVNTQSGVWRQAVRGQEGIALAVLAHEQYHLWQHQTGCLPAPWRKEYDWLIEGSATYVGWETVIATKKVDRLWVEQLLRELRAGEAEYLTLRDYEREVRGDAAASLAYTAFTHLAAREFRLERFHAFCGSVAKGVPWRQAFERAYGVSVDDFYRQFEMDRS